MTRIWYQSSIEFERAPDYRQALAGHFERVADAGTTVDLFGVPVGTWGGRQPSDLFGYPLAFHALLSGPFIGNALKAEREGYDAFVIGTYIEPFLREIRSAVGIPVVSSFEATLLVACSIGRSSAILTMNRNLLGILRTNLEKHGLGGRVGSLAVVEPELVELEMNALLTSPESYLDCFRATALEAVRDHADVIVPAEGILAELVAQNGIREIGGAAVVDGIAVPVAYAEMMAKLWARSGLRTGRGLHYARLPDDTLSFIAGRLAQPWS